MQTRFFAERNRCGTGSHGYAKHTDALWDGTAFILQPLPHGEQISVFALTRRNQAVLHRAVAVVPHVEQHHIETCLMQPGRRNQHLMVRFARPNAMNEDDPRLGSVVLHDPSCKVNGFSGHLNGHVGPGAEPQRLEVGGEGVVFLMRDVVHVLVPKFHAERAG